MFSIKLLAACVLYISLVHSDVSHLKNTNKIFDISQKFKSDSFNGYYYEVPSTPFQPLPLPQPTPPASTMPPFFIPEIIINKQASNQGYPSNVYLPPTERPIPPLADEIPYDNYLPPSQDFPVLSDTDSQNYPSVPPIAIPVTTPESVYLPPTALPPQNDPSNEYLPPTLNDAIPNTPEIAPYPPLIHNPSNFEHNSQFQQIKYSPQTRILKDMDFFRSIKQSPLQLELNELRCLRNRGGYFKANIIVQSLIENVPVVDVELQDPRCQVHLVRNKFVVNIASNDFARCGVYACSDKELCVKLRFPQIFGMKTLGDALLTLQCKLQERIATKTHALRFGINNLK